jgi:hypothetical protein
MHLILQSQQRSDISCNLNKSTWIYCDLHGAIFRDSSVVEQEAVNFEVAGSSPVPGAKLNFESTLRLHQRVLLD